MTVHDEGRMDRQVAGWIDEGPTRAPAGLLDGVLGQTAAASQRPGWLARANGAPTLDVAVGRRPVSVASWIAIALAAALAASAVLIAGSLILRDRSVVVLPTTSPGPDTSTGPSESKPPIVSGPELVLPREFTLRVAADLGFEIAYPVGALAWDGYGFQTGDPGLTLAIGGCAADLCPGAIAIKRVDPGSDLSVLAQAGTVVLSGATDDELATSWEKRFGSVEERRPVDLGGAPALQLTSPGVTAIFARHADATFVLQHLSGFFGPPTNAQTLRDYATRFRFIDDVPLVDAALQSFQSGLTAEIEPGWRVWTDRSDLAELVVQGTGIVGGELQTGASSWIRIDVSSGPPRDVVAAMQDGELALIDRVRPAELWRASASFGEAGLGEVILMPDADPVAILPHDNLVVTFTAHVQPGAPSSAGRWADAETLLRSFIAGIDVSRLGLQPETLYKGVHLSVPSDWVITMNSDGTMAIDSNWKLAGLPAVRQVISAVPAGSQVTVVRPIDRDLSASFVVSGPTLEDLAASVERALGLAPGTRVAIRVGGSPAYAFPVAQLSVANPLVAMAIFEHDGVQFVVVEHHFVDSPVGTSFNTLLDGITFAN
jgi:hypothetical protein